MIGLTLLMLVQPISVEVATVAATAETNAPAMSATGGPVSTCERLDRYLADLDRHEVEAREVLSSNPSPETFDQALERLALVVDGRNYVGAARQEFCDHGEAAP